MVSGLSEWIAANKDLIQANVSESMRKLAQTVALTGAYRRGRTGVF